MQARMEERIDALQRVSSQTNHLVQQLNGALASISSIQGSGRRLLAETMFHSSIPGREIVGETPYLSAVTTTEARRYSTAAARYQAAHWRAARAAELARRSIEQRLGMSIADMRDLVLVSGEPATLVRTSCEFEALDYSRIRDSGWADDSGAPVTSYADGYIGDYVRDLGAVMDSYPYAYPYTDGTDIVVVSLRDDINPTRVECAQPSRNLLWGTAQFASSPNWIRSGCDTAASIPGCISVRVLRVADARAPDATPGPRLTQGYAQTPADAALQGMRLDFGTPPASGGALEPDAALSRAAMDLPAGIYRLSWYGRAVGAGPAPGAAGFVSATGLAIASTSAPLTVPAAVEVLGADWERHFLFFEQTREADVAVAIDAGAWPNESVELAGLMLERAESVANTSVTQGMADADGPTYYPTGFSGTDETGMVSMPTCEDTFFNGGLRVIQSRRG